MANLPWQQMPQQSIDPNSLAAQLGQYGNFGNVQQSPLGGLPAGGAPQDQGFFSMESAFGGGEGGGQGWAPQGLIALSGLGSAWTGMQQLELGKDTLDFNKAAYNTNLANQVQLTNSSLEDQQRARIGSTGNNNANGSYDSLSAYMDKSRVSGTGV